MVDIRGISRDEVPAFREAVSLGFGGDLATSERSDTADERYVASRPVGDLIAGVDRGRIVATFASCRLELTVPGGVVPMAGASAVTVQPTHRRRGILSTMMARHLRGAAEQGRVLGGLWASEEEIYGRFGYGHACPSLTIEGSIGQLSGPGLVGELTMHPITVDQAAQTLPAIYDQYRLRVAGSLNRNPSWWQERHLGDHEVRWGGASSLRVVVCENDGGPSGYITYRQRPEHSSTMVSSGTIEVMELVALDDDTRRALWRFVAGIDLFPTMRWSNCPIDEPIFLELDRSRRLLATVRQSLWLRLLDVPAAFEARSYESDGTVVLGIIDPQGLAAGTFRLEVANGAGQCTPVTASADLELQVADAGAVYLGGVPVLLLARAGRVRGRDDAVRRLDAMLRTARAPHAIEQF